MAALGTATITGKTGTGLTMTAGVFTGVRTFTVDIPNAMISLYNNKGETTQISISAASTFTVVLDSLKNYTITVS